MHFGLSNAMLQREHVGGAMWGGDTQGDVMHEEPCVCGVCIVRAWKIYVYKSAEGGSGCIMTCNPGGQLGNKQYTTVNSIQTAKITTATVNPCRLTYLDEDEPSGTSNQLMSKCTCHVCHV